MYHALYRLRCIQLIQEVVSVRYKIQNKKHNHDNVTEVELKTIAAARLGLDNQGMVNAVVFTLYHPL